MNPSDPSKICLITGATAGLGKATALRLAQQGVSLVLVGRSQERCDQAVREIKKASGHPHVDALVADLASQQAVHSLAQAFKATYPCLHILINNAGTLLPQRCLTEDGVEMTFAVNYLARFLLTHLLLDVLIASAPSRVVNVAGAYHAKGNLHLDDLALEQRYDYALANNRAKLADVLFTYELARRLKDTGVTVNCLHPGAVRTDAFLRSEGFSVGLKLMYRLVSLFFKSPAEGTETTVFLATAPEAEAISGAYFVHKQVHKSAPKTYDRALQRRLWDLSARLTNLRPEETPLSLE